MTRLTSLEEVTFPITVRPLFSDIEVGGRHERLIIDSHKVLFSENTGKALSVVSRDCQVVTNEQAVEIGGRCCRDLLEHDPAGAPARVADHCYGCTAGQGSSCGGALDDAAQTHLADAS